MNSVFDLLKSRGFMRATLTLASSMILTVMCATPCFAQTDKTPSFTDNEREYIKTSETITVGIIEGRYPFPAVNKDTGEVTGIFVDLCELISQKSGLKFKYVLMPQGVRGVD